MTNVMEEVREFSIGRYDGTEPLITPLTLQEAKDAVSLMATMDPDAYRDGEYYIEGPAGRERVRDEKAPLIASKVTDHAKAYLVRQAREGWATVNGQHVEPFARALGDSIYIIQAAQSLAFHQESFDRAVEAYRQG
jgi:hypothetical protein